MLGCTHQILLLHTSEPNLLRIVDNALELVHGFHKLDHFLLVGNLLGEQMPTAERGKIALSLHTLLVGLGQEEIDRVVQERTLVEVSL